jgi:pimeloyl-ACP methyl ester carboxylesterase
VVPEDRMTSEGRKISLSIIVLPATGEEHDPDPIFPLHGGPGAAARFLIPLFASSPLRESRDFVFVDQRGTGQSNALACEPEDLTELMDVVLTFAVPVEDCLAHDADPRLYLTSLAMDDLDDVRQALGYETINLWGGSYGSRAALDYMRRHPARVRSALLDGAAPTDMYIPLYFPAGAERALDLVFEDCAADEGCHARFPDPAWALDRVLNRLQARPESVWITDPRTEDSVQVPFDRDRLAAAVLFALYNSGTAAQLPWWIQEAESGNLGPLADFAARFATGLAPQFSFGMMMAVACAEDAARYTLAEAERLAEGTWLGTRLARDFLASCAEWPDAEVEPEYWGYTRAEAPTLILSGQGDPVTPPEWADRVAEHLPNARHVVFTDNGHGATQSPCGSRLFTDFVAAGSVEDLDAACAAGNERPAWGGVDDTR